MTPGRTVQGRLAEPAHLEHGVETKVNAHPPLSSPSTWANIAAPSAMVELVNSGAPRFLPSSLASVTMMAPPGLTSYVKLISSDRTAGMSMTESGKNALRNLRRRSDECHDAGLPQRRFHDLRHSCATLLLVQGVSPRVVIDVLGHSQIGLTMNTYSHVIPDLRREAARTMDDLIHDR
jgi:hypothetical protein